MSMRKRIFWIHMMMMAGGLFLVFIMITGFIRSGMRGYMDSGEWISNVEDDARTVQEKIEETDGDWDMLARKLMADRCALIVYEGNKQIYPRNEESHGEDRDMLERLRQGQRGIHTAFGNTYVDADVTIEGKQYYIAALFDRQEMMKKSKHMENQFSVFLIRVFIWILILIFMGWFFSRYLVNRMMEPLELVMDGLKRMAAGKLEQPVVYHGDAELELLCQAFNQVQEKIKQQNLEREQYEKNRTDMVTSISHDLRTPLTSMKGYIKAVLDGVAKTPETEREYLQIAYDSTEDMDRLLQKLFLFSKIETGQMPFDFVEEDLGKYICRFVENYKKQYAERGAEISTEIMPGIYKGNYDLFQMERVLINLLENSLNYAGSTPLCVTIKLMESANEEVVCFADNGNGVPSEKIEHIFERFYRCDEARGTKGSGVGLYIVKYIIEAHGGYVEARNHDGLEIWMHFPKGADKNEENTHCGR